VTAGELTALAIAGIEQLNPMLHAVIETFPERVLERTPRDRAFAGVPFLLKDIGATQTGIRSELGSRLTLGRVAEADTRLGARFRDAGLVTVGRTSVPEFGLMPTTESVLYGRTCSPWSVEHSAGGSSGGAAAAVAAGIVPIAHANDGGGSIRVPAACCGVVGLKPSRGRVSWAPAAEPVFGWAVELVVSRTIRDTAAALDLAAGPAPGDPVLIQQPTRSFLEEIGQSPGHLRIAVCTAPWSGQTPHPELVEAVHETASTLADMGHEVVEATPEFSWEEFLEAEVPLWAAATAHDVDSLAAASGRAPGPENLEPATMALVRQGRRVTASDVLAATERCNSVARSIGRFFTDVDLLVTSTLPGVPSSLGAFDVDADLPARELAELWARHETFTSVFNMTGQPALSLPLHQSEKGLPIGIQLVARIASEAVLIRVGSALEEAYGWSSRQPPIHIARVQNSVMT
jgi:amidase